MLTFLKNNPIFSKIAGISLFSKVGDRLFYTAMLTTAASLPNGNTAVMMVSISETLPILLSFFLGTLADKKKRKIHLLIQNSFVRTVMYLSIGLLFNYPHTLFLLFLMASFNFISDLAGNYSSALVTPFTKNLVKAEDMEQAQGIISMTTQLINVLATFAGATLLSFFYRSTLAYINASVFFIVGIGYFFIYPELSAVEKKITVNNNENTLPTIKKNFKLLLHNKSILNNLFQLSLLNGFFGGLTPIFVLFIQTNQSLMFIPIPIKISLLSALITVAMVFGNALNTKLFLNVSIGKLNNIASSFISLGGIALLLNNFYLVFVSAGVVSFLLGIVSPRFSAKIINKYPTEHLGGIVTTVNSLLVLTPPMTSFIFPILTNVSLNFSYFGFILYSIILLVLSFVILKHKKTS